MYKKLHTFNIYTMMSLEYTYTHDTITTTKVPNLSITSKNVFVLLLLVVVVRTHELCSQHIFKHLIQCS